MSEIKAHESLSGKLSCTGGLSGQLSIMREYDPYTGSYKVIPRAFNEQTLQTANKMLIANVTVTEVPYFETGNDLNGVTVYIAKEV